MMTLNKLIALLQQEAVDHGTGNLRCRIYDQEWGNYREVHGIVRNEDEDEEFLEIEYL